jgi:hypothetical protein
LLKISVLGKWANKSKDPKGIYEILLATPLKIHSARKVKRMFRADLLAIISSDGMCPNAPIYIQVCIWCEWYPSDTGFIEGINNMIKAAKLFAPSITDSLLSSRVTGRLAILDEGVKPWKVSDMEPRMELAIRTATNFYTDADGIMGDLDRWKTPLPTTTFHQPQIPCSPLPFPLATMLWARHYNAMWVAKVRLTNGWAMRAMLVLPCLDPESDDTNHKQPRTFCCPLTHGWSAHLCPCDVERLEKGVSVKPRYPLSYVSSILLFAGEYHRREQSLPFIAWTVSECDNKLKDEDLLGLLAPWTPPKSYKGATAILSITDDSIEAEDTDVLGPDPDHAEANDLYDDVDPDSLEAGTLADINADTALLQNEAVGGPGGIVDQALEAASFGGIIMSDQEEADIVQETLESLKQEGTHSPPSPLDLVGTGSIDDAIFEAALQSWRQAFTLGMDAGRLAAYQRSQNLTLPVSSGNACLLVRGVRTTSGSPNVSSVVSTYFHWPATTTSKKLDGVEVRVDHNHRLIFSIVGVTVMSGTVCRPLRFKCLEYPLGEDFDILLHDVGQRMSKDKGLSRPRLPDVVVRFKSMCDIALARKAPAAVLGENDSENVIMKGAGASSCFVCKSDQPPPSTCSICMRATHGSCVDVLS